MNCTQPELAIVGIELVQRRKSHFSTHFITEIGNETHFSLKCYIQTRKQANIYFLPLDSSAKFIFRKFVDVLAEILRSDVRDVPRVRNDMRSVC